MISVKRRGVARFAAAALVPGLVAVGAIATAGPAAAEDTVPSHGGATATLSGLKVYDQAIVRDGGGEQRVGAGLFEMAVDNGGALQTYCIDIHNPTQQQAKYKEVDWSESSLHDNKDAGKIRWILQHSYPQVNDLAALAKQAKIKGRLTEKAAAAGTQVAIWRFSDDVKVKAVNPAADKLADYLEKAAKANARALAEPKASLTLDPPAVSGKTGGRIGPVTVRTSAAGVTVSPGVGTPKGVKIVGADGKPVSRATNGSKLFFDVPAGAPDGAASLTVQATAKVAVGRAFTGIGALAKSQTQILAGSSDSTVTATATGSWKKEGAIPAVSAEKNCAKGGVDVTATNKGDKPFHFEVSGKAHEVAPGKSETITVPVGEDRSYEIEVKGDEGYEKTFSGVLDCETASNSGGNQPSANLGPAAAGGTGADHGGTGAMEHATVPGNGNSSGNGNGGSAGDLAATGASSATPVIAGVAAVLVAVGGGTVFLLRRKKAGS
ncbi:Cys-Gln thioester bond-forming surface protein [Streptomyces sp. NPDC003077]|uniref:Cys-Gln thioester bond-forming surface protein n=1 Tax=Streptomyces sp. NPDC003077 TaxID=3154443 RepID=UPI0033B58059